MRNLVSAATGSTPAWAGKMAMHHGSMNKETRLWVEEALRHDRLKLVVCTSSLDLGWTLVPLKVAYR